MNLLKDALLTTTPFFLLLESNPDEAIVGYARSSEDCPLARLLSAQGFKNCEVTSDNVAANIGNNFYWLSDRPKTEDKRLPIWASLFVALIDNSGASAISASCAIKALKEAFEVAELPNLIHWQFAPASQLKKSRRRVLSNSCLPFLNCKKARIPSKGRGRRKCPKSPLLVNRRAPANITP